MNNGYTVAAKWAWSAAFAVVCPSEARCLTITPLDYPGALRTQALGISGSSILGTYHIAGETYHNSSGGTGDVLHGFILEGSSWTTLDYPGAIYTSPSAMDGNRIVGTYQGTVGGMHGFVYDGDTWTTLDIPGSAGTYLYGICGETIVGSNVTNGWLFDGTAWTSFRFPDSTSTSFSGVLGERIVGSYSTGSYYGREYHGFLFDGVTWTTLDFPGAEPSVYHSPEYGYTSIFYGSADAIAANGIVGTYGRDGDGSFGFIYDGSNWTSLDFNGSFQGMSGDRVVGYYADGPGIYHGFVMTVPEPATILLLVFALMFGLRAPRAAA